VNEQPSTDERLCADGWRECPNQFKKYARCYYKRFDTPTPCALNYDKPGIQVEIAMSEHNGVYSLELELAGELRDGTWIKLHNYGLPKTVDEVIALIPRLVALWEAANGLDIAGNGQKEGKAQ